MREFQTVKANTSSMSDAEFIRFLEDNPDLRIERDSNKVIYIMAPTFTKTSIINNLIAARLTIWNFKAKTGYVTESNGSYFLKDSSLRVPDVAWFSKESWNQLSEKGKKKFIKLCPEFVVEVKSTSDSLSELHRKMKSYIKNGVQLGWLIDPDKEKAWIYRSNGEVESIADFKRSLSGENVLKGFTLKLRELRID